jgi:hypothetical protein
VEAAQVAAEQAIHNRFPPVQNVEHIRRREGGVVEEGDLHIGHFLPNVVGRQPQVVVMNPDQGIIGGFFAGGFGKQLIDVLKVLPVGAFVGEMLGEGVQNGPEGFLGGDVVKIL